MGLIYLVNTVDVDNDNITVGKERDILSWNSLENIRPMRDLFSEYGIRTTWFVRADEQIQAMHGRCDFLLAEYRHLWESMADDEIGWHPHLYSFKRETGKWSEDSEADRQAERIFTGALKGSYDFKSVRIGETLCNNSLMNRLSEFGMSVDSTALPGRRNWESTPNHPFHPSKEDHKAPCIIRSEELPILEVPMTTMLIRAPYDKGPFLRYVNLSFKSDLFREGLEFLLTSSRGQTDTFFLVTVTHPDEVDSRGRSHQLYSFSMDDVRENIETILGNTESAGHELISITMKDVPAVYE
jgi:hypothetical protein